jgi:hypothetical protein
MSAQIIVALIGFLGLIVGAIPTYIFMRQRKVAEVEKLHAETDKVKAEAEKIRAEYRAIAPAQSRRVKILFVAANPGDFRLNLGAEIRGVAQALRSSKHENEFELEQLWGAQWQDLRRQLLRSTPEILHFAGHSNEAGLFFEDETGRPDIISTEQFVGLLLLFSNHIRLVLVNAAHSKQLCKTLAESIDFVIGMGEIADEDAIKFASAFYEALGDGKSVQAAFDFAKANLLPGQKSVCELFVMRKASDLNLLPGSGEKA